MSATAGQRDKLVTIQSGVESRGPTGQPVMAWSAIATVWMRRTEVSGTERMAAAQRQADVGSQWQMPYLSTMDPELVDVPKYRRLRYQNRTYDITRADLQEKESGEQIVLTTKATSGL
jgi:SPP1 family predicted phage head-tail adaptor